MRVIHTQLWPEVDDPTFGTGVYVGVDGEEHVAHLTEGERVILREAADVEIDAIMHRVIVKGRSVWFGAMIGEFRELPEGFEETPVTASDATQ